MIIYSGKHNTKMLVFFTKTIQKSKFLSKILAVTNDLFYLCRENNPKSLFICDSGVNQGNP